MPEKYKLYNIAQIKLQMSIRYIYILILILLFNNQVIAQEYNNYIINVYQNNNILPHNSANCLLQDNYGFIWIGTDNGVCCFDGYKNITPNLFTDNFTVNHPVYSLFEDNLNRMWIGTDLGIFIYDRNCSLEKFNKTTKYKVAISSEIKKIIDIGNHRILIATMGQGFFIYDFNKNELSQYNSYSSFIMDAHVVKNDIYLVTLWDGVILLNQSKESIGNKPVSIIKYDTETQSPKISFISKGINSLWFGGNYKDLYELSEYTGNITCHKLDTDEFYYISSMIPFYDNNFLLGTNNGTYIFNPNNDEVSKFEYAETINLDNRQSVNGFAKDYEGGMWVLTEHSGVIHINKRKKIFNNCTIPGNYMVNCFCDGRNEDLVFIGTQNGLFQYSLKEKRLEEYTIPNVNLKYDIRSLCRDNDDLWIGTESNGIIIVNTTEKKAKYFVHSYNRPNSLTGNKINKILRSKNGNIIIGTNWGVCYYNREKNNFRTETTFGAMMTITDIYEDSRNNIWFATNNNGIYKRNMNTRTWKHYQHIPNNNKSLPNNSIIKIFENKEKQIIFSTNGNGLCRFNYDDETFINYNNNNELLDRMAVSSIEQDSKGDLWMSTNNGLYSLPTSQGSNYNHFTYKDGLQRNFYCERSSYLTSDGTIMFGGSHGFNIFNPTNFERNNYIPPVYITDINLSKAKDRKENLKIINNKTAIYLSEEIKIPYSYNSFTINFASLSYMNPESNTFSYKMEGLDNNWFSKIKNNYVTYNNLAPGKYCLCIKGTNNDQVWNENITKLHIIITPPWYLSAWAYCIYILLAIFILATVIIKRDKSIKKKYNLKISRFKEEKEKELYKNKVNFFINLIHEIRTPLTLIKLPLDNMINKSGEDKENIKYLSIMNKNVEYLLNITNELLDFQKMESGETKLNLKLNNINSLLNEIYQQFVGSAEIKHIELKNTINENLTNEILIDKDKISRIIVNLLSNAMKHARSRIYISSYIENNYINILIEDDGPGIKDSEKDKIFNVFYQSENSNNIPGTGIGLAYARTLAESHHGKLSVKDSNLGGAAFILSLPLYGEENKIAENNGDLIFDNESSIAQDNDIIQYKNCTILLVEDNPELLEMESSSLKKWFKILKARNGKEALSVIESNDIDIIVSDVMMPIMDGLELCKRIKNNIEYSHIPVILLTAKTLPESKAEGFYHGADAYVEKPFTIMQLFMQIRNLLKLRDTLQKRIQPLSNIEKELGQTEAFISNKDLEFLRMLEENINSQLSDENFSIDSLATVMNMSRSNFYRKLKALTGLSPNDYLKNCRLNKAAELLKEGHRITEVYEQTGFCSSSYFAKCFKAKFGVLPKDFQCNKEL